MVSQVKSNSALLGKEEGDQRGPLRSSDEGRIVEGKGAASNDQMSFREQKRTAWCKKNFPLFEIPASFLPSKMASPCTANWP